MFVEAVRPSTDPDEYPIVNSGAGPFTAGGTRNGYDHEKSPVCADTCHVDDGPNGVAS
ncbi:MAG: hypothetical protein ACRDT6_19245 [Micromonosporaceae bacterium]